jgi:hypothetical protein
MDRETAAIVHAVRTDDPEATFAVAGTGSLHLDGEHVTGHAVAGRVDRSLGSDVVDATAGGGLFLDADALQQANLSAADAVGSMNEAIAPSGAPLFADAFPAFSVAFARYC